MTTAGDTPQMVPSAMTKAEFYAAVDALLGCAGTTQLRQPPSGWQDATLYRGRWGPREPGPGRYRGLGLVRWFSADLVQLALVAPRSVHRHLSAPAALALLGDLVAAADGQTITKTPPTFHVEAPCFSYGR